MFHVLFVRNNLQANHLKNCLNLILKYFDIIQNIALYKTLNDIYSLRIKESFKRPDYLIFKSHL